MIPDQILAAVLDSGMQTCTQHSPPCHRPISWVQLLALASLDGHLVEITTTLRIAP